MLPEPDWQAVADAFGHKFNDISLMRDALTHRSFANERPEQARTDNERLEFLGDAVLSQTASTLLYERFPEASEGELTRRRADLVCEAHLARMATEMGLAPALRLGKGEDRSGGRAKPRLLCSALEACIAAVLLDGGAEAASDSVRRLLEPWLSHTAPGARDFKTRAQEYAQARYAEAPRYLVVAEEGPDHARRYRVHCVVAEKVVGEGEGGSKSEAEQAAARVAMEALEAEQAETPGEAAG